MGVGSFETDIKQILQQEREKALMEAAEAVCSCCRVHGRPRKKLDENGAFFTHPIEDAGDSADAVVSVHCFATPIWKKIDQEGICQQDTEQK